jgi:uncharacterized protein YjiS (DUF1127 family)
MVLATAGISSPKAFVVTYEDGETCFKAVERLRQAFPDIPIISRLILFGYLFFIFYSVYFRASDMGEYFHLLDAGVTRAQADDRESSMYIGSSLLSDLGIEEGEISAIQKKIRSELEMEDSEIMDDIVARRKQLKTATEKFDKTYEMIMLDNEKVKSPKVAMSPNNNNINSLRPILNEVAKNMANIMSTVRNIQSDSPASRTNLFFDVINKDKDEKFEGKINDFTPSTTEDIISNTPETIYSDDPSLGVTVCILPPKKTQKSTVDLESSVNPKH